ncbi:WD_REPEATS_REGION domain-containing protein [Caenorhabditis elegans]|uniref:WD_REPEATS_REGION domain-containing protein n=1 Tax=Caenorhabditis elegans TaxID=6239 RepID=Q93758_CAEEL|nr:WD_REPEATS_REGION domain-containing protein [Caenorhabditis elegans]CAB02115.1 WD_REPEATS_REGION domain-containing protein [Caenorhabditis elegans]|eukprot:NP_506418.1 Seven WD repeats, AN11 family [Caenorhabditis elegans]
MATNGHAVNGEAHVMQQVAQQPAPPGPLAPQGIGRQNEIVIGGRDRRCEIYKFTSDQQLYASAWSNKNDIKFRLAVGTVSDVSVNPCAANKVSIVQLKDETGELVETASFPMEFPANAVGFIPDPDNVYPDLIATTSDCLRLWRVVDGKVHPDAVMINNTNSQYGSALTSFDWNELEPRYIGVSSVDTTCTIYDVEVGCAIGQTKPTAPFTLKTQLIAHDKPVHDIEFAKINGGRDHFATVGADGSARMFDLRHLNHSTIVYEDPNKEKLQRLSWNKQEPYFMALFAENSQEVQILDIRMPCNILCRLRNHTGPVNGIAWAPHSPHHICTAGDDSQALIWDLQQVPRPVDDPILAYSAGGEVNQIHWGPVHSNWIAICFNKTLEILRV